MKIPRAQFVGQGSRGIALVITLLMLSVITFLAVALLILTRSHRAEVTGTIDQSTSRFMAEAATARAEAEIIARMAATNATSTPPKTTGDLLDYDIMESQNFYNANGFVAGQGYNITNVNYANVSFFSNSGADWAQNIANLYIDPRPPVFIVTNSQYPGNSDFRFWWDINRNGQFEASGTLPVLDETGTQVQGNGGVGEVANFNGEPEWIGVLKYPEYPHSSTNPFVGRYAFLALPIGKTLDYNYIHNFSKSLILGSGLSLSDLATPATSFGNDGYRRDQGIGSWELNLAGMLYDINTNLYNNGYVYTAGSGPNRGLAFDDAVNFLRFRYGDGFEPPASIFTYFGGNPPNYLAEHLDMYSTGTNTVATVDWPGSYNSNAFYDIQDVFDPIKTSPNFVYAMETNSTYRDSYDRYTFERLIGSIGTGSEPELQTYVYNDGWTTSPTTQVPARLRTKVNLNWDNSFEVANNLNASPTVLVRWQDETNGALNFFTNAAESLVRSQDYPFTNTYVSNGVTYEVLAYNHFGLTNIPIYSQSNATIRYSENLHRMLQLAANIYAESTTNIGLLTNRAAPSPSINPVPPVFRPLFFATNYGNTNIELFIVGYTNVTPQDAQRQLTHSFWYPNDPNIATRGASGIQLNDNVWGIPWVVGVEKGLPQFDRYTYINNWTVIRKLLFTRHQKPGTNEGDPTLPPQFTNQLYIMTITNAMGVDAINDYPTNLTYPFHAIAYSFVTLTLSDGTNSPAYIFTTNYAVSNYVNVTTAGPKGTWPGWGWASSPVKQDGMLPFLNAGITSLPISYYSPTAQSLIALTNTTNNGLVDFLGFNTNDLRQTSWPVYPWTVSVSNTVLYMLEDSADNVLDFVNLGPIGMSTNLSYLYYASQSGGTQSGGVHSSAASANIWDPTPVTGRPSLGVLNQIANGVATDQAAGSQQYLDYLTGKTPSGQLPDTSLYFSCSNYLAPQGLIPLGQNLEVNDPLVHYTVGDLTWPSAVTYTTLQVSSNNLRYEVWPSPYGDHQSSFQSVGTNTTFKDPKIYGSYSWNFPTNSYASVGILGQVHRGTPWQTLFLKSDPQALSGNNHYDWTNVWVNTPDTYPTNDYVLLDLFTAAPNDNAARGLLSVNQQNDAPWAAVFSGLPTLGTNGPINPADVGLLLHGTTSLGSGQSIAGIYDVRGQQPNGIFHRTGEILASPMLSVASPYLPAALTNCTDAEVEMIPQQVMGLLKVGTPRFVVYGYGQSLKPKDLYFGPGTNFGICTNYQITGEYLTRTVLHVVGDPLASSAKVVVDSFNIVPQTP